MTYSQSAGYLPVTVDSVINDCRLRINTIFDTTYTAETFVGTNWYKLIYSLSQKIAVGETKAAEIFLKLQQYISQINEQIEKPAVSVPGVIDKFSKAGYLISVKPMIEADAGKIYVCVDTDGAAPTYAATKLAICTLLTECVPGGIFTMGPETLAMVLTNGQSFNYSFYLPNKIPILIRLTIGVSSNTPLTVPSDETIRQTVFANINSRYRLGWNFEPQRYYDIETDAPWADFILFEYSTNAGASWVTAPSAAAFNDKLTFMLGDIAITVVP